MSETTASPLFSLHLGPLLERLDDEEVIAYARALDDDLATSTDPRLQEFVREHGMLAILSHGVPMVIVGWPDHTVGPAWLHAGQPITDCLIESYRAARSILEAIHLQHMTPAGSA